MSAEPQAQSAFISRLPREIRDAIYLELCRSVGLRQHIIWHGDPGHFCRWRCTTEFELHDTLQDDIEQLRRVLRVPLGGTIKLDSGESQKRSPCRALQSPWMNHWRCGQRAWEAHGIKAVRGCDTSGLECWIRPWRGNALSASVKGPYMPMMLSCKKLSAECLQSIYQSTTFIFTDLLTLQNFFGMCPQTAEWLSTRTQKLGMSPPVFFREVRNIELTLSPDFPLHLWCVQQDDQHQAYDFHWMRLNKFESLQSIKIWIASRSISARMDDDKDYRGILQFDIPMLREVSNCFAGVPSVTISTPLSSKIAPYDGEGFTEDKISPSMRIYKRNTGDHFHPRLSQIYEDWEDDEDIFHSMNREVRLKRDGHDDDVMPEVYVPAPRTMNVQSTAPPESIPAMLSW